MNTLKMALAGGVALAALAMSAGTAQAQIACGPGLTVGSVTTGNFTCQDEDKIYSNFDYNLISGTDIAGFDVDLNTTILPIGDLHSLTLLSPGGAPVAGPFNFTFSYTITIDPAILNRVITSAQADATQTGTPGLSVVKDIDGDVSAPFQLVSLGGNADERLGLNDRSLDVDMTVTSNADTTVTSIIDTYFQRNTDIPEPLTLSILGVGLAGLGFAAHRRRAA